MKTKRISYLSGFVNAEGFTRIENVKIFNLLEQISWIFCLIFAIVFNFISLLRQRRIKTNIFDSLTALSIDLIYRYMYERITNGDIIVGHVRLFMEWNVRETFETIDDVILEVLQVSFQE